MISFVISGSTRLIPFKVSANKIELGTIRLLASAENEGERFGVSIQVLEFGVCRLSFEVSREKLMLAGEVFDFLTFNPYVSSEGKPNPLTPEKIDRIFKEVEGMPKVRLVNRSPGALAGVREIVLLFISRGLTYKDLTGVDKEEGGPSLEATLMKLTETMLRGDVPARREGEPPTIWEKLVDFLMC